MLPPDNAGIGLNYVKTIVYYYYQNAFQYPDARGYASAISIVLFVIILIVTICFFIYRRNGCIMRNREVNNGKYEYTKK